jgi:hypothetical protein
MHSVSQFQILPLYQQIEIRDASDDAADVDCPQWERGDEPILTSAQCILVATRSDLEGPVDVEVWVGVDADDQPPGYLLFDGELLTTGHRALIGNSLAGICIASLSRSAGSRSAYTPISQPTRAGSPSSFQPTPGRRHRREWSTRPIVDPFVVAPPRGTPCVPDCRSLPRTRRYFKLLGTTWPSWPRGRSPPVLARSCIKQGQPRPRPCPAPYPPRDHPRMNGHHARTPEPWLGELAASRGLERGDEHWRI